MLFYRRMHLHNNTHALTAHCLTRRHRSAISSLLIPCEQLVSTDQPCRKHMLVTIKLQACSHRAAGGGTARHRATGHHSTHPSHPPPSPAPATAATQSRRWGKVGAVKPATLHGSPRDQGREFFTSWDI